MNEWGFRPHLRTYRLTLPREPPEDGQMNEMTLPSKHRIRNLNPGGLSPSTLPLGHGGPPQYWIFTSERWNLNVRAGYEPAIAIDFPSRQLFVQIYLWTLSCKLICLIGWEWWPGCSQLARWHQYMPSKFYLPGYLNPFSAGTDFRLRIWRLWTSYSDV